MRSRSLTRTNILLILLAIVITVVPLYIARGSDFEGADTKAEKAIAEINPNYTPWFASIYQPPSSEIESLLFALQAALGAGFIGYYLGSKKAMSKK